MAEVKQGGLAQKKALFSCRLRRDTLKICGTSRKQPGLVKPS